MAIEMPYGRPFTACLMLLLLLQPSTGQVFRKGKCPPKPVLKNFNWELYLGKWYEQERYFTFYEEIGTCWTGTYFKNSKTGGVSVKLSFQDVVLKRPQKIFVDVFAEDPYQHPNRLTYTVPGIPLFRDHYEVLATDYINYTIEYSCTNTSPIGHMIFAWILTRSKNPSYDVIAQAKAAMKHLGVDPSLLEQKRQKCY